MVHITSPEIMTLSEQFGDRVGKDPRVSTTKSKRR
jgi:hypothetical protein